MKIIIQNKYYLFIGSRPCLAENALKIFFANKRFKRRKIVNIIFINKINYT
jgi:hypothetical protein